MATSPSNSLVWACFVACSAAKTANSIVLIPTIDKRIYRICSIRRRGYYLFRRAILCSFYSRAATNQKRRILNSVLLVKYFVIVRALRKASFITLTNNCDAVAWFWSKPSSLINRCFATKQYLHGTSNPFLVFFQWFHTMIALRAAKCLWTACVLVPIVYTHLILYCHSRHGVCWCAHVLASAWKQSYACATRILAAASIREQRLFCSARPEVRQQFKSVD